ncbi:MAG: ABC transporter ATP-binding protein [Chitinophagales bacterium]|nr:ABC transporter ATP-binding protein [Chitinophagales bacterium]
MTIQLTDISKRFGYEWIFKKINYQFLPNEKYAILGNNGSGKSTLLKIIANGMLPSFGKIAYNIQNKNDCSDDVINQAIGYAAPYVELINEFTITEMYEFHASFKTMAVNNVQEFLQIIDLEKAKNKSIKQLSSGMKQRVKLGLILLSDVEAILLDEPTTNLDENSIQWYHHMIEKYTNNKTLIISSNQPIEYEFCKHHLHINDYK